MTKPEEIRIASIESRLTRIEDALYSLAGSIEQGAWQDVVLDIKNILKP